MMHKHTGLAFFLAGIILTGLASGADASDSRTLVLEVPASFAQSSDSRAYDDRRVVEKHSAVMDVADDGSWMIVGESTFVIGSWFHDGRRIKTKLLDASGNAVNHFRFKHRDRVYVKGVARKDGTLFACVIQKR